MILEVNILTKKRVEAQAGGRDTTPAKWRGEWKSEETYLTLQKVSREGSSYVCIKSCVGVDPAEDVGEGAEGTYWILIAKRGDDFTYDDFTPEQLEALKGAPGNPGKDGSPGADGSDGVGIASIEQTTTSTVDGGDNVFTVTLTNGAKATFTVKNGSKGRPGADGQPGSPGADGNDGVGIASIEQTASSTADGGDNVFTITLTNGKTATFTVKNGSKGSTGADGADGQPGENGKSAYQYAKEAGYTGTEEEFAEKLAREDTGGGSGEAGKDGVTFIPSVDSSGNISWTNDGGLENPATVNIRGPRGYQGYDGQDGQDGEDGRDGYSVNVRSVVSESDRTIITLYDEKSASEKVITVYNGTDGYDGQDGEDGVGISSIAQTTISSADGGNNVFTVTLTNGVKATFTVKNGSKGSTGTAGKDGSNGADGAPGQRGTGILKITTAPSSYTTAIGSYTPKYRIALSTVISQAKVDKVLLGDVIQYSYYQYHVDYLDATYAYISATRTSIRGATGAAGATAAEVIAALTTETWTFTLEDGSTVEKQVVLK